MQFGLRTRVAFVFAVLSMLVAVLVASGIYLVSRSYLTNQRQSAGLTRALLDARSVDAAIAGGTQPGEVLNSLPVVQRSQVLMRVGSVWYSRGSTIAPSDIPTSLIDVTLSEGGAQQTFQVGDEYYSGVGVYTRSGLYVELFPLSDLRETLRNGALLLIGLALGAFLVGGALGRYVGGRLLRPLELMGTGARRLADGDLSVRLPDHGDPDLDQISDSFNYMASAVASRIERERRFVANVSHELRSPLTTIVATAELLEAHRDSFDPRQARLIGSLATQTKRMTRIVLDLLEISSVNAAVPVQHYATDVAELVEGILVARNLDTGVLHGDRPIVATDARRVERVVANLVDNATFHGRGLRQVVIEVDDDHVCIHVDDAGPGLSPDVVDSLFEPFARGADAAERGIEGAGLGLAIVRDQATAIGARVTVAESPFGGARFTLELPREEAS